MFENKDEYLQHKEEEFEQTRKNGSLGNKIKGALAIGMMIASVSLSGCGKQEITTPEETTQVQQDTNLYNFYDNISNTPTQYNIVDVKIKGGTGRGTIRDYYTSDGHLLEFDSSGCALKLKNGNNYEEVAFYQGAAIIKADFDDKKEIANDTLTYKENSKEKNIELY